MSNIEELYASFSSECHLPSHLCKSMKTNFPIIQSTLSRRLKEMPPDAALYDSAVPICCLLGAPARPIMSNSQATVVLIALNSIMVYSTGLLQLVEKNIGLGDDKIDMESIFNAFQIILQPYNSLSGNFQNLIRVLDQLKANVLGQELLTNAVSLATTCYTELMSNFQTSTIGIEPILPYLYKFLLDNQSFALLATAASTFQEFKFSENIVIEATRLLLQRDRNQSAQLFQQMAETYAKEANNIKSGPFTNMRILIASQCIQSSHLLAQTIVDTEIPFYSAAFAVAEQEVVDAQFSNTFLSIFQTGSHDHEFIKQLVYSLTTRTQNPLIAYLCSAASYYPETAIGFVAEIAALLPLDQASQIQHLSLLVELLLAYFGAQTNEFNLYLTNLKLELAAYYKKPLQTIATPASTLREMVKYVIILGSLETKIPEAEKSNYLIRMQNVSRVMNAMVIATASLLRLYSIFLAQSAFTVIEKNQSVDQNVFQQAFAAFSDVALFSVQIVDVPKYQQALESVTKLTSVILSQIEYLSSQSPCSLVESEQDFLKVLEIAERTYMFFSELQEAFQPITGVPLNMISQEVMYQAQIIYPQLEAVKTAITQQPEAIGSVLPELQLSSFQFNMLLSVMPSLESTSVRTIISQVAAPASYEELSTNIDNIAVELQDLNSEAAKPHVDQAQIQMLNFNNSEDIMGVLALITNQTLQASSADIIQLYMSRPSESFADLQKFENNLRELLAFRISGAEVYNLQQIAAMDPQTRFKNAVSISVSLPLYAGEDFKLINQLTLPIIQQETPEAVNESITQVLRILQIATPLKLHCLELINLLATKNDVEAEIANAIQYFGIQAEFSQEADLRARSIYNIVILLAYANACKIGFFDDPTVEKWVLELATPPFVFEHIVAITNEIIISYICTATLYGDFSPKIMKGLMNVIKTYGQYSTDQLDDSRRKLVGTICQLPIDFAKNETINREHALNVAFIDQFPILQYLSPTDATLFEHLVHNFHIDKSPIEKLNIEIPTFNPQEVQLDSTERHRIEAELKKLEEDAIKKVEEEEDKFEAPPPDDSDVEEEEFEMPEVFIPTPAPVAAPVPVQQPISPQIREKIETHSKSSSSSSSSSSDDDLDLEEEDEESEEEPMPEEEEIEEEEFEEETPEVIEQEEIVEEIEYEDDEEEMQMKIAHSLDAVRASKKAYKQLIDAAEHLDPSSVKYRYDQFIAIANELSTLLVDEDLTAYQNVINKTEIIISEVVNGNKSQIDELIEYKNFFREYKHGLQDENPLSALEGEMNLMIANIETLHTNIEKDPNLEEIAQMEPLKQTVATESIEILRLLRLYGKIALNISTNFGGQIPRLKTLIKSCSKLAETAQLFYLLTRLCEHDLAEHSSQIVASCRRMQSSLYVFETAVPIKQDEPQVANLKQMRNDILSHLQNLLDCTSQAVAGLAQTEDSSPDTTMNKLNAEAEVYKRRKLLDDAEDEVRRLASISED